MKKVGFLIFCLFAMCSMAGKAQDVVADSTGYIVKVGEMAPDFTVKLTDGKSITLSGLGPGIRLRGDPLVRHRALETCPA